MSAAELRQAVADGGRFVVFQYCISVIVMSFKRSSPIIFVRKGEGTFAKGIPYSLISLVAGWWGIPWGPVWTLITLAQNVSGGKDVTAPVLAALGVSGPAAPVPPPMPLSPTEAAALEEREARKTLYLRLGLGALALVILFGVYAVYKIYEVGKAAARNAPRSDYYSANSRIAPGGTGDGGNNDTAKQMASNMTTFLKAYREKVISQAGEKGFMDENDRFMTFCYLREDRCVFLIHVPELRRFSAGAKQSLADGAWLIGQKLASKGGQRLRLAVALKGISMYDRVLVGESLPGNAEQASVQPIIYEGFNCEKNIVPWFASPSGGAPNPTGVANSQTNLEQQPAGVK
jgi:hypothetical protein